MVKIYDKLNNSKVLQAIRESLIMIFPIIALGAFSLVLRSFPVDAYQNFIHTFGSGIINRFLSYIYNATFGVMSIYMVVSLAICFINKIGNEEGNYFGAIISSLFSFVVFSGLFTEEVEIAQALGVNAVFTAIVSTLLATVLYHWFQKKIQVNVHIYTSGAGDIYHQMLRGFLPAILVGVAVTLVDIVLYILLGAESFQEFYMSALHSLFQITGRNFFSALLDVLIVHLLWFFGIHGGNVLDVVNNTNFEPALSINAEVLAAGGVPTEIYSKSFLDIFVLMGGCGSTLCLLLAILIFEKRRGMRKLANYAIGPSIFNINELLLFGVPIVFNPTMMIPFFLTPIANLVISTAAMKLGIVPVVSHAVEWTTPIFLGGYYATGSVSGALLQGVNLMVGILIYRPFVLAMAENQQRDSREKLMRLEQVLKKSESSRVPVTLLALRGDEGLTARLLSDELENRFLKTKPPMYYQPQYDREGNCFGAEALLLWNHDVYGKVYSPLTIKLLEEMGQLTEAEMLILKSVFEDMEQVKAVWGENIKISVNVTGDTIQLDKYEAFLREMKEKYPMHISNIMLEITEQANLQIEPELIERLTRIKEMGYRLAIDDFSMGSTSIKYLKSNVFDMIKLDGGLSRDVIGNERSRGIVRTLGNMAEEFGIQMLAEFVETEEQREMLEGLGCYLYQGYLYSPAVTLEKFLKMNQ